MTDTHRNVVDPCNAAHVDFERKCVTLYNGDTLPLVKVWDDEGEEIDPCTLDLHDTLMVVYGPYQGNLWTHEMRRSDRVVMQ